MRKAQIISCSALKGRQMPFTEPHCHRKDFQGQRTCCILPLERKTHFLFLLARQHVGHLSHCLKIKISLIWVWIKNMKKRVTCQLFGDMYSNSAFKWLLLLFELMWISHMWQVWDGVESGRCLRAYTCHTGAVRDAFWTSCGRRLLSGSFDNTAAITDVETGEQQHFRPIRQKQCYSSYA